MLTLFDKRISVRIVEGTIASLGFDPENPKVADFPELEASKLMAMSGFSLGAAGSESGTDPAVNGDPNAYFGSSNYQGQLCPFRYLDKDGAPIVEEDKLWPLIVKKGSNVVIFLREGPGWNSVPKVGQEVSIYEATTDNPQPADRAGYVKKNVPLAITQAFENQVVSAADGQG